ncbi:MAG: hypothetical protein NT013_24455 [Planctomycetia bacterium]|nr:hypothetical protein [Planctomycetia bacterium]
MSTTAEYLAELTRDNQRSESDVLAHAIETGLRQLWREKILEQYVRGQMTRDAAIEAVGLDLVETAERQSLAMREDLAWANQAPRS